MHPCLKYPAVCTMEVGSPLEHSKQQSLILLPQHHCLLGSRRVPWGQPQHLGQRCVMSLTLSQARAAAQCSPQAPAPGSVAKPLLHGGRCQRQRLMAEFAGCTSHVAAAPSSSRRQHCKRRKMLKHWSHSKRAPGAEPIRGKRPESHHSSTAPSCLLTGICWSPCHRGWGLL